MQEKTKIEKLTHFVSKIITFWIIYIFFLHVCSVFASNKLNTTQDNLIIMCLCILKSNLN